jgi:hypothetical protein
MSARIDLRGPISSRQIWTATPEWDSANKEWATFCPRCGEYCGEAESGLMVCDQCECEFRCEADEQRTEDVLHKE